MAWDSEVHDTVSEFSIESIFTNKPTLNPGELAHCQVKIDFTTTPSENVTVSVYATLGTDYDTIPILSFEISSTADPNTISFPVSGFYQFEIGVESDELQPYAYFRYRTDAVDL